MTNTIIHSKDKGDIAEYFVISHLLTKGYTVSKTVGDNKRYDLIVEIDGKLHKVQVKMGRYKNGIINIPAYSSGYIFKDSKRILFREAYSVNDVDYLASYCPETNKCYFIKHTGQTNYILRIDPPKNNQILHITWAKDYEI